MENSYPGQERWLRDYCASGLYILTLLLEGYGFSEETWPNIAFREQVSASPVPASAPGEGGAELLSSRVSRRPAALTLAGRWGTC